MFRTGTPPPSDEAAAYKRKGTNNGSFYNPSSSSFAASSKRWREICEETNYATKEEDDEELQKEERNKNRLRKKALRRERKIWEVMVSLCLILNSIWLLTWWVWRNDWPELDGFVFTLLASKVYPYFYHPSKAATTLNEDENQSISATHAENHLPPWHSYTRILFIYFVFAWIYSVTLFVGYFFFTPPPPSTHADATTSHTTTTTTSNTTQHSSPSYLYSRIFARPPPRPYRRKRTKSHTQTQHYNTPPQQHNNRKQLLRLHRVVVGGCVVVDVVFLILFGLVWPAQFDLVFIFLDAFSPFIHATLLLLFTAFARPFILLVFSKQTNHNNHNAHNNDNNAHFFFADEEDFFPPLYLLSPPTTTNYNTHNTHNTHNNDVKKKDGGKRAAMHRRIAKGLTLLCLLCLYTYPLWTECPFLLDGRLPPKPDIIAHRGGAADGPENTLSALEISSLYNISGIECDIKISYDGTPFLMHDDTLVRTTNIREVFPNRMYEDATSFNISELMQLQAASSYVHFNPFHRIFSENQKQTFLDPSSPSNRISTLDAYLQFAKQRNLSILFDLSLPGDEEHPFYSESGELAINLTIAEIQRSGISPEKVWWNVPRNRTLYSKILPGIAQTFGMDEGFENKFPAFTSVISEGRMQQYRKGNIKVINTHFSLSPYKLRQLLSMAGEDELIVNVYTVNEVWLYSVMWCMGIHSVTTNEVILLSSVVEPLWVVHRASYINIALLAESLSLVVVVVQLYCYQRKSRKRFVSASGDMESTALFW